jgi:hypothetical protein
MPRLPGYGHDRRIASSARTLLRQGQLTDQSAADLAAMARASVPDYSQLLWPTIEAVRALGGSGSIDEIVETPHQPNQPKLSALG